jgi:hypothetical protein
MTTSGPFQFAKYYKRPQFERPLSRDRAAESDDDQMPTENLSDLLGQVSENSTGGIDSIIGELERLRGKLKTDAERIQREIEEYAALSQQVMQFTKVISDGVDKVRASVDRPQEKEWKGAFGPLHSMQQRTMAVINRLGDVQRRGQPSPQAAMAQQASRPLTLDKVFSALASSNNRAALPAAWIMT